jgi:hypothetical protein
MITRNIGFTFGRTEEGDRKDYEDLLKRLEQQKTTPPTPPATGVTLPVVVPSAIVTPAQTNQQFWTIPNVNYRGAVGNVDVLKTLLDNETAKTQSDWVNYSEQSRLAGNFYTPDYPLFYATLDRALDLKDEKGYKTLIEEMRTTLQGFSRANWLMTLTRIAYQPSGKDRIIHNYGLKDNYEILQDFIGVDGVLPAGSNLNVYHALLGTTASLDRINKVFNWLNDTMSNYIFRINKKPKSVDERVAWFDAYSGGAFLSCDRVLAGSGVSLGVRFARRVAPSTVGKTGGSK